MIDQLQYGSRKGRTGHPENEGCLWALLTLLFETVFGLAGGSSIHDLLAAYNPTTGNLWLLVWITTLVSPRLVTSKAGKR